VDLISATQVRFDLARGISVGSLPAGGSIQDDAPCAIRIGHDLDLLHADAVRRESRCHVQLELYEAYCNQIAFSLQRTSRSPIDLGGWTNRSQRKSRA
jgi:hypothetical protein